MGKMYDVLGRSVRQGLEVFILFNNRLLLRRMKLRDDLSLISISLQVVAIEPFMSVLPITPNVFSF